MSLEREKRALKLDLLTPDKIGILNNFKEKGKNSIIPIGGFLSITNKSRIKCDKRAKKTNSVIFLFFFDKKKVNKVIIKTKERL